MIGRVLWRFGRVALPTLALLASGYLQTAPEVAWLIPVLAALGKAIREKFPTAAFVNYLPF